MAKAARLSDIEFKRTKLPAIMVQREEISLWSILKQSIGKELSKITMPVVFNEPLSFLQRLTEYMEYCDLIYEASKQSDPVKRLEYVAAFAVSALASNWDRVAKPFNPLLLETYELDRHNETYTWTNVNCSVHNLVMGKPYIEQHGILEIVNHMNNLKCVLNFKPSSNWFGRDASNHIEGHIIDKRDQKHINQKSSSSNNTHHSNPSLKKAATVDYEGSENMNCIVQKRKLSVIPLVSGSQLLWRVNSRPECSDDFYHFTLFSMMLNDRTDAEIPPTDSRLRPDMRCMEEGNLDEAAAEKHRLEEKQRGTRNERKRHKLEDEGNPLWFSLADHPKVKDKHWRFNGKYWDRDWSGVPDIF